MKIAFDSFPDSARLWVYQSSRSLTSSEEQLIMTEGKKFVSSWKSHGQPLKADVGVEKNRFIIFVVDDEAESAGGCSIDASVNLVKNLGTSFDVDFLDRKKIAFLIDNEVVVYSMNEIGNLVTEGKILPETLTFNNLVQNHGEWKSSWLVPASETWLKRYFN